MAAVSAWAKPGAWALDSEEHEATAAAAIDKDYSDSSAAAVAATADFPSLAAAKDTKKKKKKTLSLAEFTAAPAKFTPSRSVVPDEPIVLPTGPRERTAEELLERTRGFGYTSSFGARDGARGGGDRREPREPRGESGPSRADEADDWGSTKRSVAPERKDRGFFDSDRSSRADDSDSWISRKPVAVAPLGPPRSSGRFEMFNREGSGVDSDTWGKRREEIGGGRGDADTWGRRREEIGGGRGDADTWGKKREESGVVGARPRLVLQPRSVPVANGTNGDSPVVEGKGKGANPFGEARPRELVLKEKGKDWKEIDEKLEAVKIHEAPPLLERKGFGAPKEDRTERAWRKPETAVERAEVVEQSAED